MTKAYPFCHEGARTCPAVIYIADPSDAGRAEGLQREARVKGVLLKPLSIERILDRVKGTLELTDSATFGEP